MPLSFLNEDLKMKYTGKRIFFVLVALFVLLISITPALAFPEPTEDFYVADYAEVLNDATESTIIAQNDLLYAQTGAQIVVVTVRYLEDGYYADEYAVKLFNDWGVGDSEKNNGILLLLVTEEGKGWLTQGSGIEAYLTNDDVDMMLENYFWKKFDKGDFDGAVETLFAELIEWYEDTYNFTLGDEGYVDTTVSDTVYSAARIFKFMFKLIIFIIIIVVIVSVNSRSRVHRRRTGGPVFWVPPPRIWHHSPTHRPPSHRPPPNRPPNSGSSFRSGGGGFSSGRSGFSSGGGRSGGGFSGGSRGGGGGRSGGGGAGRR